jgi:UDP-N-acetylmuramate dehydrogenase
MSHLLLKNIPLSLINDFKNYTLTHNLNAVFKEVDLLKYTSFRIGGPALVFLLIDTTKELELFFQYQHINEFPWKIIGGGTNLLISSSGFPGMVIKLGKGFNQIRTLENDHIEIGSANRTALTAKRLSRQGYSDLEFLCTLPGTIGGAVVQNAGCFGSEIAQIVENVEYFNGREMVKKNYPDIQFNYRYSEFIPYNRRAEHVYYSKEHKLGHQLGNESGLKQKNKGNQDVQEHDLKFSGIPNSQKLRIISSVCIRSKQHSPESEQYLNIQKNIENFYQKRRKSQPRNRKSAGSIFMNPEGRQKTWELIDACGLRGKIKGGAQIAPEHANFIVNKNNASSDDVFYLIQLMEEKVWEKYSIKLEREVELLGLFNC